MPDVAQTNNSNYLNVFKWKWIHFSDLFWIRIWISAASFALSFIRLEHMRLVEMHFKYKIARREIIFTGRVSNRAIEYRLAVGVVLEMWHFPNFSQYFGQSSQLEAEICSSR